MNNHFLNFFIGISLSLLVLSLKWWAISYQDRARNLGKFLLLNALFRTALIIGAVIASTVYFKKTDGFLLLVGFGIGTFLLSRVLLTIKNISVNNKL